MEKRSNKLFSKALFKQSCKANGVMWAIITVAVCFMLSCVMLISGSGDIAAIKDGIEDTIIKGAIDAQVSKRALNYYELETDALAEFDSYIIEETGKTTTDDVYKEAYTTAYTEAKTAGKSDEEADVAGKTAVQTKVYTTSISRLQQYAAGIATNEGYEADSNETQEILGCIFYALNPAGQYSEFYTNLGENPPVYDVSTLSTSSKEERAEYISDYCQYASAIFLSGNMTDERATAQMVESLKNYGVTKEKYASFGYTYERVKEDARATLVEFIARYNYELSLLDPTSENYVEQAATLKVSLVNEFSGNFLSTLPQEVSDALEEVGGMNLYNLIVGSIFYKMAGLLLPIIYVIMASNSLIAGQVDSGSMAYILSTSTKRRQVSFTQGLFLILSILAMTLCTMLTSIICLAQVRSDSITLSYGKLILMNLGFFCVLIAISGICFLASAWFNRSKKAMEVGGGLSMFFLVATMLGLFGSPALPSIVRLSALNAFNYVSVISLFDVISILDGTGAFIWKYVILIVIGLACYLIGSWKFEKKDLPL